MGNWVTVTRCCFLCPSSRSSSRAKQNNPLYITSIYDEEGGWSPCQQGPYPLLPPLSLFSRVMLMMTYSSKVSHYPLIRKK